MVQNEVDRFTIDIHPKFDIPLTTLLFYHLSLRCGFIFTSEVFASCIACLHNYLPIYCCTIISIASHLLSTVYAYVKEKVFIIISLSLSLYTVYCDCTQNYSDK